MNDDASLLREFAQTGTESAFAELVRRHIDLVHSAALRQVAGDAHRAEDVTQAVFVELARQARRLASHRSLAGWLYTTARHVAARNQRTEQRRLAREQSAHAMNDVPGSPPPDWAELRPLLDEAMHRLSAADREAVVLRVFQNQPLAAVGGALGVSENAARMRVDRALERLRQELARRGVVSTAAALASVLGAHAVTPAPTALAAAVSAAAWTIPAASWGTLAALGEFTATFMTTKKWLALGTLLLTGAAVGPRLLPPPAALPPAFEAQFTEPEPAPAPTPGANLAAGFRWDAIEAADYRQFIANLRASGAPERLIRDTVALELLRTFAPRYRAAADPVPPAAYWQKTAYRPPSAEQQKRLADLSAEMAAILHGLFGPDISADEAFNLLHAQPDWQRVELAWLSPETASKALALLEPILRQERAEQQPEEIGEAQERRVSRRLQALEAVLTPAQMREYRHRNSDADRNLKAQLRHWDPTEQEFLRLAEMKDHFIYRPPSRMEDLREREAKARKLFGAERAASFLRATDLSYGYAVGYARQAGLPPDVADQVWQIKQATLAEDERLRLNSQLPPEALQQERTALVRRTEEAMSAVLGPNGLRYQQQDWPWWQALEKP
jgi:RNA polymerase sigma factor (sigma-70 family)